MFKTLGSGFPSICTDLTWQNGPDFFPLKKKTIKITKYKFNPKYQFYRPKSPKRSVLQTQVRWYRPTWEPWGFLVFQQKIFILLKRELNLQWQSFMNFLFNTRLNWGATHSGKLRALINIYQSSKFTIFVPLYKFSIPQNIK